MRKKALAVDNSIVILELMTYLLQEEDYEVMTAVDGLSALDILRDYVPDIMFVDLVMPNIDGRRLCKIIRGMEALKETYLVILSATAAEEKIDIVEMGANAFIAKGPIDKMSQHIKFVLSQPDVASSQSLSGQPIGFENIYPRRVTMELLSVKKHFELLLETMSEGILEITLEGRILFANPLARSLVDVPEERLLGSDFIVLFDQDDRNLVSELLRTANDDSESMDGDSLVRLNEHLVKLTILPVSGDKKTSIIIFNDVTDEKRAEEALRRERDKLQEALAQVKTLSGLLPICSNCKKIRDDTGYWKQIETFISQHSEAEFTHSICPECVKKLYPNF